MMDLKRCQLQDLEKLRTISHKSYKQHYSYLWSDQGDSYIKSQLNKNSLRSDIIQPESDVYFIMKAGQEAGVVKLNFGKGILELPEHQSLEIQRIYLLTAFTGQGLGTKTLKKVELLALEKKFYVLWLKAMLNSPALRFYQKNGYNIMGQSKLELPNIKPHLKEMCILVKHLR